MKDLFASLNDVVIDFENYEDRRLTEPEKRKIKQRLTKLLRGRQPGKTRPIVTAAALLLVFCLGFTGIAQNPGVLAHIPLIGASLEGYIHSNRSDLQDYKTVIGTTVEDNGIEIRLNEVLLDNGRLVVSNTFRSYTVDLERVSMTPTVYIDGKKIQMGSHGSMEKVDEFTCLSNLSLDLEGVDISQMLNIRLSYNDMFYTDTGKRVKGHWEDFEFSASGQKLMSETRTVVINRELHFEDGQEIVVKDLVISPFSTTLNYSSVNGSEHISFEIEDQDGNRQFANRAKVLSAESYNRFEQKSLEKARRATIIPVRLNRDTGKFEPYPDQAFEVNLDI